MKEPITFESTALNGTVFGERITLQLDGASIEAVLAPWAEIRQLGILPGEGRPHLLEDGRMAVVFNRWDADTGTDIWFVTHDSYETILGTKPFSIRDLANHLVGAVLTCRYSDGTEEAIYLEDLEKVFSRSARFRATDGEVFLSEETMRHLLTQGWAVFPGGTTITIS